MLVFIDYSDGTRREWRPPIIDNEPIWPSFQHARIRKFVENVLAGRPPAIRVGFAYYVLTQLAKLDLGPIVPVRIEIVNERWPIDIDRAKFDQPITPTYLVVYSEEVPAGGLL